MVPDEQKDAFRQKCLGSGIIVERIIAQIYTSLSAGWRNATVVDGGANSGFHTMQLAALPHVDQVLAFEPHPETIKILREQVSNSPVGAKVRIVEAALQADPATTTVGFSVSNDHPGRSGINPVMAQFGTKFENRMHVAATTLDEACRGATNIRFLKLDLEGGEYGALSGGRSMLREHRPVTVFESSKGAPKMGGYDFNDVVRLWEDAGMKAVTFFGEPLTELTAPDFWYGWAYDPQIAPQLPDMLRGRTA